MKPHKHAAIIKAWADGAVIQYLETTTGEWADFKFSTNSPNWLENTKYRASLAFVEGKPVFEGDKLYVEGLQITIVPNVTFSKSVWEKMTWSKPKPKTVMVELLVEDAEFLARQAQERLTDMYAIDRAGMACRKALGELK